MWGRGVVLALAAVTLVGCGSSTASAAAPFRVTSPQITRGGFPWGATCDGGDHRPNLLWVHPPSGVQGYALELIDIDAPGGTFTHWLLYDIPGNSTSIGSNLPKGSVEGYNEFGKHTYSGPCPPRGHLHHYYFYVIALDQAVHISGPVDRYNLEATIHSHVIGRAELVATYKR
jgi:Raf kinase inhibitor-like YbhB/YbcL family protein